MSEFLIITGMSGAGRSTAADTFEDGGWFVIDNMPPSLIGKVAGLISRPSPKATKPTKPAAAAEPETERVALVVGRAGPEYVEALSAEIAALRKAKHDVRILFLDAADDVLVRRFEGTRRRHPMAAESVSEGIRRERTILEAIKSQADVVVDTSELNVHQLRGRLIDLFERDQPGVGMKTTVVSFGYKHGIPLDVDLVFDCRFLPNPHWVDELRPLTGLDDAVREYVMQQPETGQFLEKLDDLLGLVLPAYVKEGKAYLTVAVGCTGGHHRSVVLAEQVAGLMEGHGFKPTLLHRDVQR
ncbi:MAG TPA: RNase adapter RapZ [Acidimicrobiales bacterium]|jgi:UPF0042 nucleotide-binding protein|nr:RNase adapter RapZ [Acidimicrobiales bacterium]